MPSADGEKWFRLTLSAQRHVHVIDLAILAENLAQVVFGDILGKAFDYNLFRSSVAFVHARANKFRFVIPWCSSMGFRCESDCAHD